MSTAKHRPKGANKHFLIFLLNQPNRQQKPQRLIVKVRYCFEKRMCTDLRMMVVGHHGVGKSATANAILGKETFRETETKRCELQSGRVEGRNISVIDSPGINKTSLTTEQWRTELHRGLLLSSPGPHVFLLVTKVGNFSEEERNAVKWIKENFGEEALKFTMILFIGREEMARRQWVTFSEDARTKDLIRCCEGRYCVINSKREANPAQIAVLMEEIQAMVQQNGGRSYTQEMYEAVNGIKTEERDNNKKMEARQKQEKNIKGQKDMCLELRKDDAVIRVNIKCKTSEKQEEAAKSLPQSWRKTKAIIVKENFRRQKETWREREKKKWEEERGATGDVKPDPVCDVRIVLLGSAQVGKSSSGNTILGREAFGNDIINVDAMGKRQDGMVDNKSITVIDTKPYTKNHTQYYFSKYCEELEQGLSLCRPGPHAFVLVVSSPNISFPVELLYERFGPEVLKRTLVLMTHGDRWGRDHKAVLNNSPALRGLIRKCGEDFQIFNNQDNEDQNQIQDLLRKIEVLIEKNGQGYCTTEMYRRTGQQPGGCSLI